MAAMLDPSDVPWIDLFRDGHLSDLNLTLMGPNGQNMRLARLVFVVLAGMTNAEGRPVFGQAVVILPPDVLDTVAADVERDVTRVRPDPMDAEEREVLARRLQVHRMTTFETDEVLRTVAAAPAGSFVIVVGGARFRRIDPPVREPAELQVPEDRWVPNLIDLANLCRDRTDEETYVLIDAGEYLPSLARNLEPLRGMEASIWGADVANAFGDAQMRRLQEWVERIEHGDILSVLGEIDATAGWTPPVKMLAKAQVLHRGGRTLHAMEFVRAYLPHLEQAPADLKLKLATMALGADDVELARQLMEASADELTDLGVNELALELTESVPSAVIETRSLAWLVANFPTSTALRDHQLRGLFRATRDGLLARTGYGIPLPLDDYIDTVLTAMRAEGVPDYVGALEALDGQWPGHRGETRLAMTLDARRRDLPVHLALIASSMSETSPLARPVAMTLMWAIERVLLREDGAQEVLADAVLFMLLYLANNPAETGTRERLDELLSVEVAGSVGMALLAFALLRLAGASQPEPQPPADAEGDEPVEANDLMALYGCVAAWLEQQRTVDLSKVVLPREMLTMPADTALRFIKRTVQHTIEQEQADDGPTLRLMALVSFALAPHAQRRNEDLEILRMVTSRLVASGEAQLARDLVEAGLAATQGRPDRLRLAWFAYGDVFHRMGNESRALLAFGCALATRGAVSLDQAYYETMGVVRALRDAGLWDAARQFLDQCERLLHQLGDFELRGHRIETMRVGISMAELMATRAADQAPWPPLLAAIDANLQVVRREDDELVTILMIAVQVMRHAEGLGIAIEPALQTRVEEAIGAAGAITKELVRLAAHDSVGPKRLLERAQAVQQARYADDVGFDVQYLVRAARAQLSDEATLTDARTASFAAELTTDHAIAVPGAVEGAWLPTTLDEPAQVLQALSQHGVRIELLAIDHQDRLIRVSAEAGAITVRREHEAFSMPALHVWSKRFPYAYADGGPTGGPEVARRPRDPNIFYTSMRDLGLSAGAGDRALFILDTRLQRLPPQLLLVNGELLGRTTQFAVAPSLTWLRAVTRLPPRALEPPAAWIPTAVEGEANGTLVRVAERVTDVLAEHAVTLHTGAQVPDGLKGAELAIVAAHGGLADDNRFFRGIADEAQLRVSGPALARALEGAGVVVLFVCNGGRQDEHPAASTAVGLPKQLLDRGSAAVIASPWPLDARVPSHWLPAFLAAWGGGQTLLEANAAGNRAVIAQMGNEPQDAMALTLYGNPFLRRVDLNAAL
jgi:hypothetical protein